MSTDRFDIVTVSPENMSTTNGGKFQGWGTSLCWWANRVGYSDSLARQTAELFFSSNGLDMNIMRYNIGGGDDQTHRHITRTDSAIPGWAVYDEKNDTWTYDCKADYNQLNVLTHAYKAAGKDAYVEVFSNSPPYFMTVSGCSSGNADPAKDNLKADRYEDFAKYMADVASYINNDLGIKVSSVSPMNEPGTDFWWANNWKQEGCHFEMGESQSKIIIETAKAFKAAGLSDVEIVGSDETGCGYQYKAYKLYSDEAKSVLDRISTHTYDETDSEKLGALAKTEGFNLWMSEVDGGGVSGEDAGEMGAALWYAEKIIRDINALSPSAWIMWQAIDSHISKEGYNGNQDRGMVDVNGGYWGLAVADHDNDTVILTQKYYTMGQFTRYIRPGMTLIHIDESTIAAYDKDTHKLVIVAVNSKAADKSCKFDISRFDIAAGIVQTVRTSGDMESGEHWAEIEETNTVSGCFTAVLKGNSITTFILR
ncbi:MAG: hypothetical protein J1E39_00795 [Eubacterium sp.]|nr:hypothetical protein [Eubacterium sp.]